MARKLPRGLGVEVLAALAVFAQNVFKDVDWAARMAEEELMENAIYKLGEAKGEAKGKAEGKAEGKVEGERKLLARLLQARLGSEASGYVSRLERCGEAQLEAAADLLVAERSRDELIAALEGLLFDGE